MAEQSDTALIWSMDVLPDRRTMENHLKEFDGQDENETLNRAQSLIYDAWEEEDTLRSVALAFRAIETSPLCADAYIHLAELLPVTPEEEEALYRLAVQAGELAIGSVVFEAERGLFWSILSTRPYIRARVGLARILWSMGCRKQAINDYWDILQLNKNDNMGVRCVLASCLFDMDDDDGLRRLFERFGDDATTEIEYARTLAEFKINGDGFNARRLAKEAWRGNPHIPSILESVDDINLSDEPYYAKSSKEEAIYYRNMYSQAWLRIPGAIEWLVRVTKAFAVEKRIGG